MNAEEKIAKLLELQEAGVSIDEIYGELGFGSSKTLNNFANRKGYRLDRKTKKYVLKKAEQETDAPVIQVALNEVGVDVPCMTNSNTIDNTRSISQCTIDSNTSSAITKQETITTIEPQSLHPVALNEFINIWDNEKDTLKEMLEWFKTYKSKNNSDMLLELPKADNTMISLRSNSIVWEQFGAFAQNYKGEFSKGDLLAQALKEFMEKYQ